MNYEQARPLVQDGDLVAVRSARGGLSALTRWVTRSPYTHTAMAIWIADGLWVAEMGLGGNHLVPLSHYKDRRFDVFDCPVERETVRRWTLTVMREPIEYDLLDLLHIAVHHLLGTPLPNARGCVCSAFNAATYLWAGWTPAGLPAIPAPSDVVAALGGVPKIIVTP